MKIAASSFCECVLLPFVSVCFLSCMLPSDASCQLQITNPNCDPFGMQRTQICVFKQRNQIGLCRFLSTTNCCALESQSRVKTLSNLTYQSSKSQLWKQQVGTLLVLATHCRRKATLAELRRTAAIPWQELFHLHMFSFRGMPSFFQ